MAFFTVPLVSFALAFALWTPHGSISSPPNPIHEDQRQTLTFSISLSLSLSLSLSRRRTESGPLPALIHDLSIQGSHLLGPADCFPDAGSATGLAQLLAIHEEGCFHRELLCIRHASTAVSDHARSRKSTTVSAENRSL